MVFDNALFQFVVGRHYRLFFVFKLGFCIVRGFADPVQFRLLVDLSLYLKSYDFVAILRIHFARPSNIVLPLPLSCDDPFAFSRLFPSAS